MSVDDRLKTPFGNFNKNVLAKLEITLLESGFRNLSFTRLVVG